MMSLLNNYDNYVIKRDWLLKQTYSDKECNGWNGYARIKSATVETDVSE